MLGRYRAALAAALLAVAIPSAAGATTTTTTTKAAVTWVDQSVSFRAGGLTVYATYRHPVDDASKVPGVLLIAGSGPTDRNGNSPEIPGTVGTLKALANWFSQDGVATLRYDKLGSGQTGLGPYAHKVASIGVSPYETEAAAALRFLAAQPGVDDQRLGVFGHSEGALYALLLATGHSGKVPAIHALGLIEPLSNRYLGLMRIQVDAQLSAQLKAKEITAKVDAEVKDTLNAAINQLRSSGHVKAGLPYGIGTLLSPSDAVYLYQADKFDPAVLAAALPAHLAVLVSCSNADLQVTCAEVSRVIAGLDRAKADVDLVSLTGVDHVLKVDPSGSAADYAKSLAFSPALKKAVASFVAKNLT